MTVVGSSIARAPARRLAQVLGRLDDGRELRLHERRRVGRAHGDVRVRFDVAAERPHLVEATLEVGHRPELLREYQLVDASTMVMNDTSPPTTVVSNERTAAAFSTA